MIIPDVNLLLYAVIDGYPEHAAAKAWWEELLNGTDAVGLCSPVLFGFLRIATNPRVFDTPLQVADATAYCEAWLARPQVQYLTGGSRYLSIAFALLHQLGAAANLTTDVQIAAYALESQSTVHSNDTDFAKFPGLRWFNPL